MSVGVAGLERRQDPRRDRRTRRPASRRSPRRRRRRRRRWRRAGRCRSSTGSSKSVRMMTIAPNSERGDHAPGSGRGRVRPKRLQPGHAAAPSPNSAPPISRPRFSYVASSPGQDADDPALEHHRDPVADGEDLVELRAHDQDRRAGVALLDEPPVDVLDRADVEAARRLRGEDELHRHRELARDDDLLLVAARQGAGQRVDRRRPDVEVLDALRGACSLTASRSKIPRLAVRLAVVGVEDVVLGDGHRGDQPVPTAVLRDVGDAEVGDLARRRLLDVVAADRRSRRSRTSAGR